MECTVIETDSSVYAWSTAEELSVYDVPSMPAQTPYEVAPPTGMTLTSSAATAIVGGDGVVTPRVLVQWTDPLDIQVTEVQIQYQQVGASSWIDAGSVAVGLGQGYVAGVVAGQQYNFQIRSIRYTGATSAWVQVNNYTVSITLSTLGQVGLDPGALVGEAYSSTSGAILVEPFTADVGNFSVPILPTGFFTISTDGTIGGAGGDILPSKLYYVYYYDPTFAGGAITPIATTNPADFTGPSKVGNFLIGSIATPTYVSGGGGGGGGGGSSIYRPSNYADVGSRSTQNPQDSYDGYSTDAATVSASVLPVYYPPGVVSGSTTTFGECIWEDFPATTLSYSATLTVPVQVDLTGPGVSGTVTIKASIGGTVSTLATLTASTAMTNYTATVPSGTNLSSITVTVEAVVSGSSPYNDFAYAYVGQIAVQ